jgi:hypothetical protein
LTVAQGQTEQNYKSSLKLSIDFANREDLPHVKILVLIIENISDSSIQIIKGGDGSEEPWREPYTYFTGKIKKGNEWENLKRRPYARCGNYSPDWIRDTVQLKPKTKMRIYWSGEEIKDMFEVEPGSVVRLIGHYDYANGQHAKAQKFQTNNLKIPSFKLESKEIEVKIE